MSRTRRTGLLGAVCLLVALGWAGASSAQYSLGSGSGGQFQIGGGLPLPIQPSTKGMGTPIGTMTEFPPLLIPHNPSATVMQTAGADPKKMTVAPGTFKRSPTTPKILGVALNNPTVFQVKTNLLYSGPAPAFGTAVFSAGGRTGAMTTTFAGIPSGAEIRYSNSKAQFGGPSQTRVVAQTPILVWARKAIPPCKHPAFGGDPDDPNDAGCASQLVGAHPGTLVAAGAGKGFVTTTPGLPAPMSPNVVIVSVPAATGLIAQSAQVAQSGVVTNMATSAGFPWTTGRLTISQPDALGTAEMFTITGMDGRVNGQGTLSLVAGSLSNRQLSGPNSNRAWSRFVLPEPGAVLGAAAAFAMLGVCHGLVRRRSR